uniref:PH domain-containing protein n=1 Tax=Ningiella ruwaisensis TaxID=2364274 RepID=UPI00109EE573|nr:PH domain-containing protein [Ningiella ruwaisensis]
MNNTLNQANDQVLKVAQFDPKVKTYWVVISCVIGLASLAGIPFIPVIVVLAWLFSSRLLKAMHAELQTRKLVVKRGVFIRVEKSIPLDKITDVAMVQGPLMRSLGIYRLSFETAGQSGQGALVSLLGIVNAADFREAILAQKERLSESKKTHDSNKETYRETVNNLEQANSIKAIAQSLHRIEALLETLIDAKDTHKTP